uniref:Uncharacterized protein n=1 Tax=viral metagenome TaxID=1070528 RepID=A0A6M3JG85_9ZZZZ
MIKVIELNKIDELLEDFKEMGNKGETFSRFIEISKCVYDDKPSVFDWNFVEEKNLIEVEED